MIGEATIREAAHLLLAAAPGSRVILFGSHARGQAAPDSDLDFVVIEPEVPTPRRETVRLLDVLRPLRVAADILVTSARDFQVWSQRPGTVWHAAAREEREYREQP